MMSREEIDRIFDEIRSDGEPTELMEKRLRLLKDELDEREGELRRWREVKEERREDRREDRREESDEVRDEGRRNNFDDELDRAFDAVEEWKGKYYEMRERYAKRFFTTPEEVKIEQEEDVKRDGTKQTFEELFERREG